MKAEPCPFCGYVFRQPGRPRFSMSSIGKAYWVSCPQCKAEGPVAEIDVEQALELWNTRKEDEK